VYAFEHALVVAVLLMMAVTYILTVLWNNANLRYDQFDQLILRIAGYSAPEEAPAEALATLTGVVSPLALVLVLMCLSLLAVRTREQSTARLGEVKTSVLWPLRVLNRIQPAFARRLLAAAIITSLMWGFVQLVSVLPSGAMCVTAILLLGLGMVMQFKVTGMGLVRQQGLLGLVGGMAAGALLALALPAAAGAWVALALALVALVALTVPLSDLVAGLLAGLALVPGVLGFLGAQIPGFIAMVLVFALTMSFVGPRLASLCGGLIGGGLLLWYFLAKAGPQYDWTSGLTAILLLYLGFLGASMATHDGRHITVDAVRKLFKSHNFHLYNAIGDIVTLLFTAFLGVMAVRYLIHLKVGGDYHAPSDLSAWIAVIPIGFGFTMMVVRLSIRIAAALRAWRRKEPAPELAPELV